MVALFKYCLIVETEVLHISTYKTNKWETMFEIMWWKFKNKMLISTSGHELDFSWVPLPTL